MDPSTGNVALASGAGSKYTYNANATVEDNLVAARDYAAALNASGSLPDGVSVAHMGPWHMGEDSDVLFVGIGSVMNPGSLKGRDLHPLESWGCEFFDFEFFFSPGGGMGSSRPKKGGSLHGVLHRFTAKDMRALDESEGVTRGGGYLTAKGQARLSTGEVKTVHLYMSNEERSQEFAKSMLENQRKSGMLVNPAEIALPSERYLTMMIEGCKHYGVSQQWITWLEKHPFRKRKPTTEFLKYKVPPGVPTWTMADVARGTGTATDSWPIYYVINGKVIEYVGPREGDMFSYVESRKGTDTTVSRARRFYDPKYGVPETLRDMSPEHRAAVEDIALQFRWSGADGDERVVALLQEDKDAEGGSSSRAKL